MRPRMVLVFLLLFADGFTLAQYSSPQLRSGETFVASVDHSIRASHAKPGDRAEFRVAQPFLLNGEVVPEGARIAGHVVVVRKLDKNAKLESLLAIVTDRISWKKKSVALSAWIVGFGSVKISKTDRNDVTGAKLGTRMAARMAETTDRPLNTSRNEFKGLDPFTSFDPAVGNIRYDPAGFIGDIRILRKPTKKIGALLVHDDGDIYLPKTLLVMLEQIEVDNSAQ